MNSLQCLLYLISLCSATQYLIKEALVAYDAIAVANLFLNNTHFLSFVRSKYETLIACLDMQLQPDLKQNLLYKKQMYESIAMTRGIEIADMRVQLEITDPNTVCYCPICSAEYRIELGVCETCNVKTRHR